MLHHATSAHIGRQVNIQAANYRGYSEFSLHLLNRSVNAKGCMKNCREKVGIDEHGMDLNNRV